MRKINAEMPSNPQQNHLGMESNASIVLDGATMTGDVCAIAGRVIRGCVFLTVNAGAGDGFDSMVMRAVSFFGPGWTETPGKFSEAAGASAGESKFAVVSALAPADFGRGFRTDEAATFGGNTGGWCGEMMGGPVSTGDGGVIVGGDRRGGVASSFWRPGVVSGLWGSAIRTASFFGSAMTDLRCAEKNRRKFSYCHSLTFHEWDFPARRRASAAADAGVTPANRNLDCP
jgi:hypothetical protein